VLLHAPHRALEHLSDLAGLEMAERVPDELGALFVVGAIESDQVEVRVEPEIGRSSLYHGDGAGLGAAPTLLSHTLGVEPAHRLFEDAREPAEQSAVLGEAAPPGERKRQHPLAKVGLGQHALHEVGGGRAHPPSHARRAKTPSFAAERHEQALAAFRTAKPREAPAEEAAIEVGLELLARVLRDTYCERPIVDGAVQRFEIVAHDFVERRRLGLVASIGTGAWRGAGGGGRGGSGHGVALGEERATCPTAGRASATDLWSWP
jgi:hypothetical protein